MEFYYSNEENVQIIISLLKAHGVKKVVASPGATNVCLVESMRFDGSFEMYSCVDERSAAYIACGMAEESGEPVALTCTGATASRNYIPGLTEAYYRKLPIIAIMATLHEGRIGQNFPQAVDRRIPLNDISVYSVQLPFVNSREDAWANNLKTNNAIIACRKNGGGPVLINWTTQCSTDYSIKELPSQRIITRITSENTFPELLADKIAIFVGNHRIFSAELEHTIELFCEKYNGVVLVDQTSNYRGKYRVLANIITYQELKKSSLCEMPLLIYIGNVSGAYMNLSPEKVWRVNPDGESRDFFKKVDHVFEMPELLFFKHYLENNVDVRETDYYTNWIKTYDSIICKIPEVPFSNIWISKQISSRIPDGSTIHLGILNSLRAWNFFETPNSVTCYSNTGGFGIDGDISSLIGASLVNPQKLFFAFVGDLAFFYDLNSIGNRHIGNNIRIMVINNGRGTEFRNYNHNGAIFGADETDKYVAAAGHYGNQSRELLKHYSQDLNFKYFSASSKEEFSENIDFFLDSKMQDKPILFEVFTNSEDESDALKIINTLEVSASGATKNVVKKVLGDQGVKNIKKILGKG